MSRKTPRPLSEHIFHAGTAVHGLAVRAAATEDLARALRAVLAPDLAIELRSANIRDDGTLVIMAGSPAWAARLRFEGQALLARCREKHPGAARIRVRVSGRDDLGES